jgi:hypothetical protein
LSRASMPAGRWCFSITRSPGQASGCWTWRGTGIVARYAASLVGAEGSVVALDVSSDMLAVVGALPTPTGAAVEWQEGDAISLLLPSCREYFRVGPRSRESLYCPRPRQEAEQVRQPGIHSHLPGAPA